MSARLQKLRSRLEDLVTPNLADQNGLRQSNQWVRSVTWALIGATAFGVGWLSLAKTSEVVMAPGKLVPVGPAPEVQLPVGGIVEEVLVKDGQLVQKGQVLLRLDTEASGKKNESLTSAYSLKQRQLSLKRQELMDVQHLINLQVQGLRDSLKLEQRILDSYDKLAKEGAAAELQYLSQRSKVQEIESRISQTITDGQRQESQLQQQIRQLQAEIADLGSQKTESNVTLRYQELRAPVTGIVFDLKAKGPGYTAQASAPVLKIVPQGRLEASVDVESNKIGFVKTGMPVELSIDSYPSSDFGTLKGSVGLISSDALPPDRSKGQATYLFPTKVILSSQRLPLKNGISLPLQAGMSVNANIRLRQVTYLQLLLGSFRDKASSIRKI